DPECTHSAGPDVFDGGWHVVEQHLNLTSEQIGHRRSCAAIWDMDHVDLGHHLEKLSGHMGSASRARRRHVDPAAVGVGISNKLRNCLRRKRWVPDHDERSTGEMNDRVAITNEIVVELLVKRGVDRVCWT